MASRSAANHHDRPCLIASYRQILTIDPNYLATASIAGEYRYNRSNLDDDCLQVYRSE